MVVSRLPNNRRFDWDRQGVKHPEISPERDDLLLTRLEIMEAWKVSDYMVRRLVSEGKLRRVRRPNYQPYYPLSSVVAILGQPIHDPTPRYPSWDERAEAA